MTSVVYMRQAMIFSFAFREDPSVCCQQLLLRRLMSVCCSLMEHAAKGLKSPLERDVLTESHTYIIP